jgi:hypothetical protein
MRQCPLRRQDESVPMRPTKHTPPPSPQIGNRNEKERSKKSRSDTRASNTTSFESRTRRHSTHMGTKNTTHTAHLGYKAAPLVEGLQPPGLALMGGHVRSAQHSPNVHDAETSHRRTAVHATGDEAHIAETINQRGLSNVCAVFLVFALDTHLSVLVARERRGRTRAARTTQRDTT